MSKIVELYVRELTREGSTMTINDVPKKLRKQAEDAATNGNGRMARNTLEKAILNQSKRLVADPDASLELLVVGDFELE